MNIIANIGIQVQRISVNISNEKFADIEEFIRAVYRRIFLDLDSS